MTRSLCTLLLACAILPACAPISTNAGGGTASVVSGGTYYCWKDRFYEDGDRLMCNWTDTLKDACEVSTHRSLPKGALASGPTGGKRCANGQQLLQVTMK